MKRLSLKQVACLLIVLMMGVNAGPMMMSASHHFSAHHGAAHHADQHADPACNILCTASHFIESANPFLDQESLPVFTAIEIRPNSFYSTPTFSPHPPRGPPA
ncbi:MAG: hypothetical protein AAB035_03955 [Nitrospirota bacterium]